MKDIVVTKEGVTKLLKGLDPSKPLGPAEINPRVLKELATELCPILSILSNNRLTKVKSLRNGLLQTFVSCSKRETGRLLATIVLFP